MRKPRGFQVFVFKLPAGGGEKTIHGRFVNDGAFLEAFALNSPVVAFIGQRDQVYSGITASQIRFTRELLPQPYVFEQVGVFRVGLQIRLH